MARQLGLLLDEPGYALGDVEIWARAHGAQRLAGLDEAGRGLAGPVVAGCVVLPSNAGDLIPGLDDSKKLTAARRKQLFDAIHIHALAVGIGQCDRDEIDTLNILWASMKAMRRALDAVLASHDPPELLLVDGKHAVDSPLPQKTLVKGDGRSLNIAAASIVAKVTRDRLMIEFDASFPGYGFARHKGYPTAQHRAALQNFGPCPIHRQSFRLG